ncbi:DUF1588 domain-containing protein [Haloferula helveola]
MRSFSASLLIAGLCSVAPGAEPAGGADYEFKVPPHAEELLDIYCYECHDSGLKKGGIRFDNLGDLNQGARLDLLNNALEQVYSGEMPPKDGDQPTDEEREKLAQWIWGELKVFNASKLEDKLRYYKYGNYVDHDQLFSGEIGEAPFTKARRWRINELIYQERVNDVLELEGRARQSAFYGVVKPFNLPQESGVRYYDTEIVEGGQFLTLMSNAKWIVDKQLRQALLESGHFQYPEDYQSVLDKKVQGKEAGQILRKYPDEKWNLKTTPEPFTRVVMEEGESSDEILSGAITHQFRVALQRDPDAAELAEYLAFMRETIRVGDKVSALKKMMVSVLMEPEFLYRNEFGGGEADEHGRRMLTPREGSYAIAYALTDRIPDPALVEAAHSGKLNERVDYEREVRRLLADESIEKPRILRFFQDYFGYTKIYDVFKDEERFVGAYNPHRVVSTSYIYRVPGKVSKEADLLVQWVLERDKDVFETLLTTDKFFVHHSGDNEEMRKRTEQAQIFYSNLRKIWVGTRGRDKKDYAKIVEELGLSNGYLGPAKDGKKRSFNRKFGIDMEMAETIFGKDGSRRKDSDATYPPLLGEAVDHSPKMYNFDYTLWDYPVEQPFKVENRIGMLTHPAWLVAHSHNAATDPILRGKWVREKLLGGFVRDVPITVDAKVPEDPHSTLRERFAVTEESKCWQCHEKMNPLGYPFESYDDFGRFRTEEAIEYPENILETERVIARSEHGTMTRMMVNHYKTKPVDPSGYLEGTGDESLDGPVKDVPDMINRLAKSDRVRQVFIRNVFRYFMGRNETPADSKTLIAADKAYLDSGGSFRELMVSILTSDSFIYRK